MRTEQQQLTKELAAKLAAHKKWRAGEKDGKRAQLSWEELTLAMQNDADVKDAYLESFGMD